MRSYPHAESNGERTPLRVLFFEDNADDIELAQRALDAAQFDVVSDAAVTLEQFRDRLRSSTYDVILSDYRMPGNTGLDCFEALEAEGINTPFILVTGSLGDEKAVECLKGGVADYVLKDSLARLPVAVRRALEGQRLKEEQARTQEALRRSEASYRSLIESAPCGILRVDAQDGHLLEVNAAMAEMLGYASPAELLKSSAAGNITPDLVQRLAKASEQDGQLTGLDIEWAHKDGEPLIIGLRGRLVRDPRGASACFEMVAENLTQRRRAEERIGQLNRLYSVLSHAGQSIVHIRERTELFREICRVVVEQGRFQLAWVALAAADAGPVQRVASWGEELGYLEGIRITTSDEPAGSGPVGRAIKEGRHVVCNHLMTDPRMAPWRERARRCGYHSVGAFPLMEGGSAIGALAIYSATRDFFDAENLALLDELAADLSFALESLAAEQSHRRAVDELNQFFALSLVMSSCSLENYVEVAAGWRTAMYPRARSLLRR